MPEAVIVSAARTPIGRAFKGSLVECRPDDLTAHIVKAALDKVQANLAALKASARSQWGSQLTELDGAVQALKTTLGGVDGNSLLSAVPTIVSDLKRIDTAWTALQQQIDQDCG